MEILKIECGSVSHYLDFQTKTYEVKDIFQKAKTRTRTIIKKHIHN